jgi:hypothetical protein
MEWNECSAVQCCGVQCHEFWLSIEQCNVIELLQQLQLSRDR